MEQKRYLSHDAIDSIVSTVLGWFAAKPAAVETVAFSDEWERQQIACELHWN
jgi:hypothetical protein